ncbi:hypothetical protein N7E70_007170 [Aminobacter sp. NyZ550]|uniref:hypothetical protein n=1 Tax=Aminobacter sp. NyZ550 TaxID=2979870 RepID=UPI0021D60A8A|nr:hypothetical protein [Aminobacter sp. NyZ550]WAX96634.1 hypothetical protein N7E70_007170 [Aminobacter sp. NyZ550]
MSNVIDFATRRTLSATDAALKPEDECDWTFKSDAHAEHKNMVEVVMLVEAGAVAELEEAHFQAWGRHMRRAFTPRKAELVG